MSNLSSTVTVRQLNFYIKSLLEGDSRLAFVRVCGELSNFKEHFSSGHLYFTLKDDKAAIKCVMFSTNARRLKFIPKDGMKVIVSGRISVFERDGAYQLYAEDILPDGEGDLLLAFEELKEKLKSEGLFSDERKKPIPNFPSKIAVITSETGAAVKDIFNVLTRRYPIVKIELIPAFVQGVDAPSSLCAALDKAYKDKENDIIIIGRGGGSAEDLWCFNDETLARKIAESKVPIISAVGHDTDFTICDFVADLRAPTPSAAAELAVPDMDELSANVKYYSDIILSKTKNLIDKYGLILEKILSKPSFSRPADTLIEKRAMETDRLTDLLFTNMLSIIDKKEKSFVRLAARIDTASPLKTLARGYAATSLNGKPIIDVDNLNVGDNINLRFLSGSADCTVDKIFKE